MRLDAKGFADQWISDWNRKDVGAVLSHFSDTVVFKSPRATAFLGSSRAEGKSRLNEYWTAAIQRIETIRFTLDSVLSDGNRVAILYIAEINGKKMRAVEFFVFGDDGLVREGEAMHGIEL